MVSGTHASDKKYMGGTCVAASFVGTTLFVATGAPLAGSYGGFGFSACLNLTDCHVGVNWIEAPTGYAQMGKSIAMAPGSSLVAVGDLGSSTVYGSVTLYKCNTTACSILMTSRATDHDSTVARSRKLDILKYTY